MDANVNRKDLLEAVKVVDRFVAKKSFRPILENLRIVADEGSLALFGTNMEVHARKPVDADVTQDGEVVVSSKRLLNTLKTYKDSWVYMHSEGNDLHVVSSKTDLKLPGEKPEDFPCFTWPEKGSWITVSGEHWREMVLKTMFAVANEHTRYALNGEFLFYDKKAKRIVLVGTDGKRLAVIKRPAKTSGFLPADLREGVIVPKDFFAYTKVASKKVEQARIGIANGKGAAATLVVDFGDIQLNSRLVEGHFPDYMSVFPHSCKTTMTIGTRDLEQALKEAMLATDRETPAVKLVMWKELLAIRGKSMDNGVATTRVFPRIEGEHMRTNIVPELVLDMLSTINGNVKVMFQNSASVVLFEPEKDPDYQYLCMPYGKTK